MLIMFVFFVLILSILFTVGPINLRKSYSQISEEHEQTFISLTNVFDFIEIQMYKFIFKGSRRVSFSYFPNIFPYFCGSSCNIQFKPYAASKMELFVGKTGLKLLLHKASS